MEEVAYRAAGGVVVDARGRVLLIERHVQRDGRNVHEIRLPKGHIEQGESDEQAALREVREESGYHDLAVLADLGTAVTQFEFRGRHIVREDHFYLMRLAGAEPATPQPAHAEEALYRPLWVSDPAAAERQLTFDHEKQFARRAAQRLAASPGPPPDEPS